MKPAVAAAKTAQKSAAQRLKIAAVCRPIAGGAVEPEFVAQEISAQGFDVQTFAADSADFSSSDVLLFLGNAAWRPGIVQRLRRTPPIERPFVAVWHWEPLPPPESSGLPRPQLGVREIGKIVLRDARATDPYTNYLRLRAMQKDGLIDLLAISTRSRQEFLAEKGIASSYVPLGYGSQHGSDLGIERDIDVLFLGDSRLPRCRQVMERLRTLGLNIQVAGGWEDPQYWGDERSVLLNRVKILLNIPRAQGDYAGLRMFLGAANGAMILSEPLYRPEPFLPGAHYIEAQLAEMPARVREYLNDDSRRLAITQAARQLATQESTRERSVARLMELIEEQRAADGR